MTRAGRDRGGSHFGAKPEPTRAPRLTRHFYEVVDGEWEFAALAAVLAPDALSRAKSSTIFRVVATP